MITFLKTKIIKLKDWLYWVGIPINNLRCECGWPKQTPKHVILSCPSRIDQKAMFLTTGIKNYNTLLLTQKGLNIVTG